MTIALEVKGSMRYGCGIKLSLFYQSCGDLAFEISNCPRGCQNQLSSSMNIFFYEPCIFDIHDSLKNMSEALIFYKCLFDNALIFIVILIE